MASLPADLASSRILTHTRRQIPSRKNPSFPTQCISKRLEMAEYFGLKSSNYCTAYDAKNINGREVSFFDVVAAQLTPKTTGTAPVRGETVAKLKVAINGFGRIGRNFLRCWHGRRRDSPIDVVVVNDVSSGSVETASNFLKYDYILGTFEAEVKNSGSETITVDDKDIKIVSVTDPDLHQQRLWAKHEIDIVIGGTGALVDRRTAEKHIVDGGAKKVIIPAQAKGAKIPNYVVGVNDKDYGHEVCDIVSTGSSTIICVATLLKVIDEEFGIVKGTITATTHSYTGDQRLFDEEVEEGLPLMLRKLNGKLKGIVLHLPAPNLSVVDLVVNVTKKDITAKDVNEAFRKAAEGPLKGILAVCDVPLVSGYFRCSDVSSTINSSLSMVIGGDMVKVVAMYDTEWGYSQRVVDLAHLIARNWSETETETGDPATEGYQWQRGGY